MRGQNSNRVKGLELANRSLKENVEFYKATAQANSYKYELMKTRARDELNKRLMCEKQNHDLRAEIGLLRNMMMPMNYMNPSIHAGNFFQKNMSHATSTSNATERLVEKASIESVQLPEALKVRAREPKK